MTLRELLDEVTSHAVPSLPVTGIACHSKQVKAGDVFVAVRGPHHDGHAFIQEAVQRGACAVVTDHALPESLPCPVVVVFDTKRVLSQLAARFYGEPASRLRLIGVTGTCGKTTTTYLIKAILEAAGHDVGLLGTVAYQIGERHLPSTNTTPGALELQRHLANMVEHWLDWCVMEVSSHALDQGRVEGVHFEAAVFTNLGSDHLDYHHTREHYAEAKRRIFSYLRPQGRAMINLDDEYGRVLAHTIRVPSMVTYGMEPDSAETIQQAEPTAPSPSETPWSIPDVLGRQIVCSWQGTHFVLETPVGVFPVSAPLVGRHNVTNMVAAAGTCVALGIPSSAIQQALANFQQVPGRMERILTDTGVSVVIDYAHTADALRLTLLSLQELVRGRVIVVFGCGGDRDRTKRPIMGKLASLLADHVVLTSDNPRREHPRDIIHEIKAGFVPNFQDATVCVDREQAILTALSMARPDDAVLIAGKGHEAYQIFDHVTVPFSDRDVVERYLARTAKAVAI